jgi:hypothetical protein
MESNSLNSKLHAVCAIVRQRDSVGRTSDDPGFHAVMDGNLPKCPVLLAVRGPPRFDKAPRTLAARNVGPLKPFCGHPKLRAAVNRTLFYRLRHLAK